MKICIKLGFEKERERLRSKRQRPEYKEHTRKQIRENRTHEVYYALMNPRWIVNKKRQKQTFT